jgi:serine/threonine protein kinase
MKLQTPHQVPLSLPSSFLFLFLFLSHGTVFSVLFVLGTRKYAAPEQYKLEEKKITNKVDVFSLGAVFLEIMSPKLVIQISQPFFFSHSS